MAYQIDFTASNYVLRSRRKTALRIVLAAAIVAVAWGVHDCYETYNRPTLNMRLADYEAVARPIEEMSAAWDGAAKEYNAMVRYYRLLWATNPTNFLSAMVSANAPRLDPGFRPTSWSLVTGGDCTLAYVYAFGPGDKAEQAKGLENQVVNLVTSVVEVVGGRVDVQGVQHENLLNVDGFNVAARFALPNARTFPAKESSLAGCVAEIGAMRRKVRELRLKNTGKGNGATPQIRVDEIMMKYLPMGKGKPGFPDMKGVIDVAGWFRQADWFVNKHRIPVDGKTRQELRETWNRIGEARFPWERYRALDNEELVFTTKSLGTVADGVRRFKGFLEMRHADCLRKLEPFVNAYLRNDVFNNPFVEADLKNRVAGNAGIASATVSFKDEAGAEPVLLEKEDERFTFTWVRWTLSLGAGAAGERERAQQGKGDVAEPIMPAMLADCARRVLELGPGYALDRVRVDFGADGTVSGAVLEGLLPVKKVEKIESPKKEAGDVR